MDRGDSGAGGPSATLLQVTETSGAGRMAAVGVTEDGRAVAFVVPGSPDAAGRGTLNETGFPSELHLARCGGTALARTG